MNINKNKFWFLNGIVIFLCFIELSCKKGWLEVKPEKALVVPTTIKDYQGLLDGTLNGAFFNGAQSSLDEHCAGDFYVTDAGFGGG